jgi:hypothetical protein
MWHLLGSYTNKNTQLLLVSSAQQIQKGAHYYENL